MKTASRVISAMLYEVSKWDSVRLDTYPKDGPDLMCPAYDLGFVLRKMPKYLLAGNTNTPLRMTVEPDYYCFRYGFEPGHSAKAKSPEDAICKLAIKLFERGLIE